MEKELKECPVCHSMCFSDMDVCYGCLHRFEKRGKVDLSQGEGVAFEDGFEPDEPNALPPVYVRNGQEGDRLRGNAAGNEEGGVCYELALTIRIPQGLLKALRVG